MSTGQGALLDKLISLLNKNYPESPLIGTYDKEKKINAGMCYGLTLLLANDINYSGNSNWFWQQVNKVMSGENLDLDKDKSLRLFFDNLVLLQSPETLLPSLKQTDSISLAGLEAVSSLYISGNKGDVELMTAFEYSGNDNGMLWVPGKTYQVNTANHAILFQYKGNNQYEFLEPNYFETNNDKTFSSLKMSGNQMYQYLSGLRKNAEAIPFSITALDKKGEVDEAFRSTQTSKFNDFFNLCFDTSDKYNADQIKKTINAKSEDGYNILYLAARAGDHAVVKKLIECGADVNLVTNGGDTAFLAAIRNGHIDVVKEFVAQGVNINDDTLNSNPLYVAAKSGHSEVVKWLIENGASVHSTDSLDQTPLHVAAAGGHLKVVELLIENGASVHSRDSTDQTPLHVAAAGGHLDVVKKLFSQGAELNPIARFGGSPIDNAVRNGHLEVVNFLYPLCQKVNSHCFISPLLTSAEKGRVDELKAWISLGANVNLTNQNGETALFRAAENGQQKVIEELLLCGAEVDKPNADGYTPLFIAIVKGHAETVKTLIANGANIYHACEYGSSPLHIAEHLKNDQILKIVHAQNEKLSLQTGSSEAGEPSATTKESKLSKPEKSAKSVFDRLVQRIQTLSKKTRKQPANSIEADVPQGALKARQTENAMTSSSPLPSSAMKAMATMPPKNTDAISQKTDETITSSSGNGKKKDRSKP